MSELISSSKPTIDFAAKEIITSMQSGIYTMTASWANAGNGFQLTIPKTGVYKITAQYPAYITHSTNNENAIETFLAVNDVDIPGSGGILRKSTVDAFVLSAVQNIEAPIQTFQAGDVITLRARRINTDPAYIWYNPPHIVGYLQAELLEAYVPVVQSQERLHSRTLITSSYAMTGTWTSVPNWTLTIPRTGRFKILANGVIIAYDAVSPNNVEAAVRLTKNGIYIPGTAKSNAISINSATYAYIRSPFELTWEDDFVAGDVITLQAAEIGSASSCSITYAAGEDELYMSYESVSYTIPIIGLQEMSAWTTYAMTIGATTTPPTKGTVTYDQAVWRRVGANMEIMYTYLQTVAGASGSGTYLFPLPGAYVIDTSLVPQASVLGNYSIGNVGVGNAYNGTGHYPMTVNIYDSTNLFLRYDSTSSVVSNTAMGLGSSAALSISYKASVPIVGF